MKILIIVLMFSCVMFAQDNHLTGIKSFFVSVVELGKVTPRTMDLKVDIELECRKYGLRVVNEPQEFSYEIPCLSVDISYVSNNECTASLSAYISETKN